MSDIVLHVEGLAFHAASREDMPRVLDVEIGRRAGMAKPTDIRRVIAKAEEDGFLNESDVVRMRAMVSVGSKASREVQTYWLTEAGALKVITRLRTPEAYAVISDMVRVYREALRQLREPPPAAIVPVVDHSALAVERAKILLQAVDAVAALGYAKPDTIAMFRVKAAEMAAGGADFTPLLPPAAHHGWLSPTQIAEQLGVSVARVGRVITQLGLRGDHDGLCRPLVNKAAGHNREVVSYVYSPEAVSQIRAALGVAA